MKIRPLTLLFTLIALGLLAVGYAAISNGQPVIGGTSAVLGLWMTGLALRTTK